MSLTLILVIVAVVLGLLYLMKRNSRLKRDTKSKF